MYKDRDVAHASNVKLPYKLHHWQKLKPHDYEQRALLSGFFLSPRRQRVLHLQ